MNFKTRLAINALKCGGVISLPTDTIQGLSCLPRFEQALSKILQLKRRSNAKGLILLASKTDYFTDFVKDISVLVKIKLNLEPTTYLLTANQSVSPLLTGRFDTLAVRLTNNQLIANLCQATDSALVSTSANITSKQCARRVLDLKIAFGKELDFMIAPQNHNNQPSRIINLQTGEKLR